MTIPFLDLRAQFETIRDEVLSAVQDVAESQQFILGDTVHRLEMAVAALCEARYGIGCASGTDALYLALKTLDLGPGDEVITTPFTFFATAGAIHNAGGRPVFVDIDPATFNVDAARVEAAVTPRTRALLPVHLFGQMAPMEHLALLAGRHGLAIIEDAAQAIGARRQMAEEWHSAGALGNATALSFFPTKNLGGWGDGGMVVTNDEALAERVRRLRTHGGRKMYHHEEVGINSRLDALQAAVLLAKLPHLAAWSDARRRHAEAYSTGLADLDDVVTPQTQQCNEHVFNQYTVRVARRDALREYLTARGIGTAVYYPLALHLQPCFAHLGYGRGSFPEAERATAEVVSLPVYPELREDQRDGVIAAMREFYR